MELSWSQCITHWNEVLWTVRFWQMLSKYSSKYVICGMKIYLNIFMSFKVNVNFDDKSGTCLWVIAKKHVHVIVIVTFVSVFTIKRPKGAGAARVRGVLMVKILNKCILSISVNNLFLNRQRNISYLTQYFHTPVNWLSLWNIKFNFSKDTVNK